MNCQSSITSVSKHAKDGKVDKRMKKSTNLKSKEKQKNPSEVGIKNKNWVNDLTGQVMKVGPRSKKEKKNWELAKSRDKRIC